MEIRRWVYCAVVNCALVCCVVGKPFSLNTLIESESKRTDTVLFTTISPNIEELEPAAERFSLNRGLKPINRISKKYKEPGKKISPLKYRKTFQIKSPLKPKRVKYSLRTRHKRKNQSIKREIDGHALLNQRYVPLLKSLGMLFDNILGPDSGESLEETKYKKKRIRYNPERIDDIPFQCPQQREFNAESESKEETVASSQAFAAEVPVTTEAAAATANYPAVGDLRSFRHHKNVPLLLPRNTSSTRGNHHGFSERSRATYNRSAERDISWDNGDSKHNPQRGQKQSNAESNEEHTDSDPRNDSSSAGISRAIRDRKYREYRDNTEEVYENDAKTYTNVEKQNPSKVREDNTKFDGPYKLKTERDERKSGKLLSEPIRREKGFLSNDNIINFKESVQSEDDNKEGLISIALNSSDDKRFLDRDGSYSSENKKNDARTETVTVSAIAKPERRERKLAKIAKFERHVSDLTELEHDYENDAYESSSDLTSLDNNGSLYTEDSGSIKKNKPKLLNKPVLENQKVEERTESLTVSAIVTPEYHMISSPAKAAEVKHLVSDSTELEQNYENYDENVLNIAYDSAGDLPNLDSVGSINTEDLESNENPKTVLRMEPVSKDSRSPEVKTLFATSEVDNSEDYDEKEIRIENRSREQQFSYDDTTTERANAATKKPDKLENAQLFSKSFKTSRTKGPMVMIIDGYSVTRHKNGENKLAEKAIRIRP